MTHVCVGDLTSIGSDNGLSPEQRQAIIWTNAGILLIRPLGTNFIEILIEIHAFSFKKMHLKMSSGKWRHFCLGLSVLAVYDISLMFHVVITTVNIQQLLASLAARCRCLLCVQSLIFILHLWWPFLLAVPFESWILGVSIKQDNLKHRQHTFWAICQIMLHCSMLSHWGQDKMAAIWQTTFSNAFFMIKILNFD